MNEEYLRKEFLGPKSAGGHHKEVFKILAPPELQAT